MLYDEEMFSNKTKIEYIEEIGVLATGLMVLGIPFTFRKIWDGYQILVQTDNSRWDAVCHSGSYGHEKNLLEIYGSIVRDDEDSVEGWLTATEVLARL